MSDQQPVTEGDSTPEAPAVVTQQVIVWKNGAPFPTTQKVLAKSQVSDLIPATASVLYTGDIEEYQGMTNIEVGLLIRSRRMANGDEKALDETLDRMLGKAKQSVEKLNVNVNYEDWLREQAEADAHEDDDEVINITPDNAPDENGL